MASSIVFAGKLLAILLVLFCKTDVDAADAPFKIVVIPLPVVSSQYFNMLAIAEEMHRRGNEVTLLSTKLLKKRKSPVKHIDYELDEKQTFLKDIESLSKSTNALGPLRCISVGKAIMGMERDSCVAILEDKDTRYAVMKADMIITLSFMVCSFYLAENYDKPFIVLHPAPLPVIGSLAQVPLPPSYVPMSGSAISESMSFFQRARNFIAYKMRDVLLNHVVDYFFQDLTNKFQWRSSGNFARMFGKAEAYIATVDFAFEFVHPLMPNVFVVGPITTKPAIKLNEELEDFMKSSGEHGVVVISFGSAIMHLDEKIIEKMIAAISRLKQKVIWKIKVPERLDIPSNLKILDWLPQNDLLGHKKTRAFVSHMGVNGATEAAYHGVPIVAACIMSDSFANALKFIQKAKMAKFIDVHNSDSDTWKATIEEVIYNSSYKENAMKTSKLMRSWPRTNVEKAGDVIQYAIDNGGRLPHLKSYAGNLYWFQYHCIDVILLLLAIFCVAVFVFCKIAKVFIACICGGRKKDKSD